MTPPRHPGARRHRAGLRALPRAGQRGSGCGRIRASTWWRRCCPTPTAAPAGIRAAARLPRARWRERSSPSECTVASDDRAPARSPGSWASTPAPRCARWRGWLCAGGMRRGGDRAPNTGACRRARRGRGGGRRQGLRLGVPRTRRLRTVVHLRRHPDERHRAAGGRPGVVYGVRRLCRGLPKGLFTLLPHRSSPAGAVPESAVAATTRWHNASVACTACGKCVLDAAPGLISVASGVAVIDYDSTPWPTRRAVARCPTGAIVWLTGAQFQPAQCWPGVRRA